MAESQTASGTIQTAEMGKNSLRLQVDGKWFSTKKFDLQNHVGKTIEYEWSPSEFNGKTYYWINNYKLAEGNSGAQKGNSGQGYGDLPMPFISNVVAHAITAGKCATPHDVETWAQGALDAYKKLQGGDGEF